MTQSATTAAELVLTCRDLDETLRFFTDALGFRLDAIFPADDPRQAAISGHGIRIRLERAEAPGPPVTLRLHRPKATAAEAGEPALIAPNGTRIEFVAADAPPPLPPLKPSLTISRIGDGAHWGVGRAGMQYRDLIADRQGGRFIASHIRIPDGGPVPDLIHYHKVRFQLIYCAKGWVKLVYEDQGPPFVLNAGDGVLQPPEIRHRVLESSPGLEVIEIASPAEHITLIDHDLELPTETPRPARRFAGQRFVRHVADGASWAPWRLDGFEARDVGIADATEGLATVRIARVIGELRPRPCRHDAEFLFLFVLGGAVSFRAEGHDDERLGAGDSVVVPADLAHALADATDDLEVLEVALPADFKTTFTPDSF